MDVDASDIVEKPNAIAYGVPTPTTKLQPLPPALLSRMLRTTNTKKYDFMKNPDSRPMTASTISSRGSTRLSLYSRDSSQIISREDSKMSSHLSSRQATPKKESKKNETPKAKILKQETSDSGSEVITSDASTCRSQDSALITLKTTPQPEVLDLKEQEQQIVQPEIQDCIQKTNVHGGACEYSVVFDSPESGKTPSNKLIERLSKKTAPGAPRRKKRHTEEEPEKQTQESHPRTTTRPTTAQKSHTAENQNALVQAIGFGTGIEDQPKREIPQPEALSEEVREQYDWMVRLLGLNATKCLLSKFWEHRVEALKKGKEVLMRYTNAKLQFRGRVFDVVVGMVHKGLGDNVIQVYTHSINLCKDVLSFSVELPSSKIEICLQQLMVVILRRAGDANQRVCCMTEELLDWIVSQPHLNALNLVAKLVTEPIVDASKAYKHVIARLKLILRLVNQYGFMSKKEDGLSPESINLFVLDVLENANRRVCQEASEVVKILYFKLGLRAIHLLNIQVKENATEEYLQRALGPLIQTLIESMNAPEKTGRMQASDGLLALAMHEKVGAAFIAKYVTQPPEDLYNSAALSARLNVMTRLVCTLGFGASSKLSAEQVMLFALTGVQSCFADVHKSATDLVLAIHTKAGDKIWEYVVHLDADCIAELRKKVISKQRTSVRGGCSVKAKLNTEIGMARAKDKTGAFCL